MSSRLQAAHSDSQVRRCFLFNDNFQMYAFYSVNGKMNVSDELRRVRKAEGVDGIPACSPNGLGKTYSTQASDRGWNTGPFEYTAALIPA